MEKNNKQRRSEKMELNKKNNDFSIIFGIMIGIIGVILFLYGSLFAFPVLILSGLLLFGWIK